MTPKNTVCLWYDREAEVAARFYAGTLPDSHVGKVYRVPGDCPSGTRGDVQAVTFTVAGVARIGLNGGPAFQHDEALSFQIASDDQDGIGCTAPMAFGGPCRAIVP